MKRIYALIGYTGILFILGACGGGGGGGGSNSPGSDSTLLSGIAADGYLRNAQVFLDLNGNLEQDPGEPATVTGNGGGYLLDTAGHDGSRYAVVVEIVAGQTVDEDNPGQPVSRGYTLAAPPNRHGFVSPLTTLVWLEMQKNPGLTVQDAEVRVRFALGTGHELVLFDDYVANCVSGNPQRAADSRKNYNAGRIVAAMQAQLLELLQQNLGDGFEQVDHRILQFILSDRILAQKQAIALDVEAAAGLLSATELEAAVSLKVNAIPAEGLNAELVAFYQQRAAENHPVWDTTSPQVIATVPGASQLAPTDTQVVIDFDEALDPQSVTNASVTLFGAEQTVAGTVLYEPTLRRLTFTPAQPLYSFTSYEVVLGEGLADWIGNRVSADDGWNFTTIFNELPPPPPEFD